MPMKRLVVSLLIFIFIGSVFGWKAWQKQTASNTLQSLTVEGPAVILIRGDNSPSCRAIHNLIDQASVNHGEQVNFLKLDWADDNPIIKKYQIQFLPTVIFVDQHDKEVGRIVGESPAVQQKLEQVLSQLDELLRQ